MTKLINCPRCNRKDVQHKGHGLCNRCYSNLSSKQKGICSNCGKYKRIHRKIQNICVTLENAKGKKNSRTIDHITPISKGGQTHMKNLVPCCHSCNASKNDTNIKEWLKYKKFVLSKNKLIRLGISHG